MDIILTGIARSGTTLACSLLNRLPQCVALIEPMNPAELSRLDFPEEFLAKVKGFFVSQRQMLLSSGRALSKARFGELPDNTFDSTTPCNDVLRPAVVRTEEVRFAKDLADDFKLVIKHPNFFTATLEALMRDFRCFALVRNPLAVLLSWNSIQAPQHAGRLPFGEAFDSGLREALDSEPDLAERQLIILRWYFARYAKLLPAKHVIKYEDLVESGGRALDVVDSSAKTLNAPLSNRNTNQLYDESLIDELSSKLVEDPSIYEPYYSGRDIRELQGTWGKGA